MIISNGSAALSISASSEASALTLLWNPLPIDDFYQVSCRSNSTNNLSCIDSIESHHTLSLCVNSNTTSVRVDQLLPGISYNCCVSAGEYSDCEGDLMVGGGLSTLVVGVIGGFAGIVLAIAIALLLAGLVWCCTLCKAYR